ncbi:MAG: hypothetical protein G3M78_10920 [Candidatus Nitrohelix vancouverensis]|uniref:Uncharacterized protein n=1 Tax=Candidatus Nitrohelix vancouverensis TaxID=2705534 RepID=A0A7T0C3H9_9BACT|nr:MAG: hypothetical protein G3M78_10920 [Candidatus Nitrohelix vancouverensis]
MTIPRSLILLLTSIFLCIPNTVFAVDEKIADCLKRLETHARYLNEPGMTGGIWAQFEKRSDLRDDSTIALKLDTELRETLYNLKFLCTSQDGIPLNELARYITQEVDKSNAESFKKFWVDLGKSPEELDKWIKFYHFSKKSEHRKLKPETVQYSIQKSLALFKEYFELNAAMDTGNAGDFLSIASNLLENIKNFCKTDSYVSQAIYENAQAPYWDMDENHGGS